MTEFVRKFSAKGGKRPPITGEHTNTPSAWASAILDRSPWFAYRDPGGKIIGVEIEMGSHVMRDSTVAPIIQGMLDMGFLGIEDKTATLGPWSGAGGKSGTSAHVRITPSYSFSPEHFTYGNADTLNYDFGGGHVCPPTRIVLRGENVEKALTLLNHGLE